MNWGLPACNSFEGTLNHRLQRIRRGASLALVSFVSLLCGAAVAGAIPDEESFAHRYATFMKINNVRDVDWYKPLEVAKGRPGPPLPLAKPGERSIDEAALEEAAHYADARGTIALIVWQGGKIQFAHYGKGSGPQTLTDTASMAKSVAAMLYGAALRDGYIRSLEDPVSKYVPEWANDDRGKITIRNLMNMASGLANAPPDPSPNALGIQLHLSSDITSIVLGWKQISQPNSIFDYNNTNSELLAIILQHATGKRYANYLSQELLEPLGAADARVWLDRPGGMAHTYCCLQMTPDNWLRIGLLLKDDGKVGGRQVLPADWIDAMMTPSRRNPNYGLQIWIANPYTPRRYYQKDGKFAISAGEPFVASDMVFFDGWGAQRVYVSRAADLVIVRVGDATTDWDDSMIPNIIMRGLKKG